MKKIFSLLLVTTMILSLCACGKSDAVKAIEKKIKELGEITVESGSAIESIEKSIESLSDDDAEDKARLEEEIDEIREKYDDLVIEKQVNDVIKLISDIGKNVTLESETAVVEAKKAYDALSEDAKEDVTNKDKLDSAEARISELKKERDEKALAENVIELISAIDENVTLESEPAVVEAKNAYDALSKETKELVTNKEKLDSAEATINELKKEQIEKIIAEKTLLFDATYDKVEDITWYEHKNMPNYIDIRSYIIPYIGKKGNDVWIGIRYNYTADSWIFWKSLTIMVDGEKYYKKPTYSEIIHDNDTEIWEYYDENLNFNVGMDNSDIQMLKAIAESEETIIRFSGDEYYDDLTVTATDKKIIKDVLALYEAFLA